MKRSRVCLVGMFPPPLHGMSLINEYVKKRISAQVSPLVIDFSPRIVDRALMARFGKIFPVIRCVSQLLSYLVAGRVGAVYLGLSGGKGQVYDAIFAGISRLFGRNLYLHHHSYQYLNQFRWLARLLFAISGENTVHIVACEKMARDLKRVYPVVTEVRIISGIAALELLAEAGIAAAAVSHQSARLGEGRSTYADGIIAHVNRVAEQAGVLVCMTTHDAALAMLRAAAARREGRVD